jgi:hypothetical protein
MWPISRGSSKGFKLHVAVNQLRLSLKGEVTAENRYDEPMPPSFSKDFEAEYVPADAGYDSKGNTEVVKRMGAKLVIASNPRWSGNMGKLKNSRLFKAERYLVQQFKSLSKIAS